MLVIFGGLPGTGKTTIAREVARTTGSLYVRIDTIEQSMRMAGAVPGEIGAAGYAVAMSLTRENLAVGQTVVADSVNPVQKTRQAWRDIAMRTSVPFIEIEIVCSDTTEHRRRVENRTSDIPGLIPPSWDEVVTRDYSPWNTDHWVIDTCLLSPDMAVSAVCERMRSIAGRNSRAQDRS